MDTPYSQQPEILTTQISDMGTPTKDNFKLEIFKLEYQHVAEGYRHTYATIWQAGSVLTAISAVLLAFTGSPPTNPSADLVMWIWPLPFFFWWLGIFTPMDRYGKLRLKRLAELEDLTHNENASWGHAMNHFRDMEGKLGKRQKLLSWKNLRVGYMVDVFGITILITWIISLVV